MKKRIKKDKDDPVGGKPGEKGLSMKFLNKLERKFGRYAVPNLMLYIIILNAAGLLITIMYPQAQYYLCWSTSAILHGQIWRIVSFILVPYTTSPVNFLIFAFLYYSISQTLERGDLSAWICTSLLVCLEQLWQRFWCTLCLVWRWVCRSASLTLATHYF